MNSDDLFPAFPASPVHVQDDQLSPSRRVESPPVSGSPVVAPAAGEMQRLLRELEKQQEQLRQAQAEAQAVRAQYLDLYDFAPVGYFTLTPAGLVVQLNLCASRQLGAGRAQLVGQHFTRFVAPISRPEFEQFLARAWATTTTQSGEMLLQQADGTTFYAQLEGRRADTPAGPQCQIAVFDITARHRATKALAISEARFHKLFDASNDAGLLLLNQHYVDCNEAALRLVGAQYKGQLVGQSIGAFVLDPQPSGQASAEMLSGLMAEAIGNGSARGEMRMRRATGEEICVEAVLTAIELREAQSLLHIVWRDVTAIRLAASQLRQSEARLGIALNASATGVITCDFDANELHLDERSRLIYGGGFAPGPLLRADLHARIHPDDLAGVLVAFEATVALNVPFAMEHRVLWTDGSVHFVSVAGCLVPDAYGALNSFAGVVRDVTAQHTAAQELHYKSLVLENLLTHLPIILTRFQPDGLFLEAVGAGLQVLGMATSELVGRNVLDLFPSVQANMQQLLQGRQVNFLSQPVTDGRAVAFQNFGFFDEQRQQAIILAVDVTEAEQQKHQLRLEKEFTQSLLENTVDGIVALDREGRITAWNAEMTRYTGLAAATVLNRRVFEVLDYFDEKAHLVLTRALAGERVTSLGIPFQKRPGLYDAYAVPLQTPRQDSASGVLIIIRDVTERDQLVEVATQLRLRRQQEVLSAVLATQEIERRRIAEALHNSLGQLLYATKLSLEGHDGVAAPPRDSLNLLEEAIRTTRTISFELTPSILEDFGLRTALEELIKRIAPARLPVQLHLVNLDQRLLPEVEIAVYRMVQELLNNVMKHAQATEVIVHVAREDGHVAVSVEDNGRGFEPGTLADQPLTGIGLAGVRNRVALLGGEVIINSQLGRGTIISFELNI